MLTNQEKLETGSVMSSMSEDQKTFITGAKVKGKQQDSPMTRAAKALAMMNGEFIFRGEAPPSMAMVRKPVESSDSDNEDIEALAIANYSYSGKNLQDEVLDDCDRLEREMNDMYRELEEMQKMIAGNKDLKVMETLMGTTQEVIHTHISSYNTL